MNPKLSDDFTLTHLLIKRLYPLRYAFFLKFKLKFFTDLCFLKKSKQNSLFELSEVPIEQSCLTLNRILSFWICPWDNQYWWEKWHGATCSKKGNMLCHHARIGHRLDFSLVQNTRKSDSSIININRSCVEFIIMEREKLSISFFYFFFSLSFSFKLLFCLSYFLLLFSPLLLLLFLLCHFLFTFFLSFLFLSFLLYLFPPFFPSFLLISFSSYSIFSSNFLIHLLNSSISLSFLFCHPLFIFYSLSLSLSFTLSSLSSLSFLSLPLWKLSRFLLTQIFVFIFFYENNMEMECKQQS